MADVPCALDVDIEVIVAVLLARFQKAAQPADAGVGNDDVDLAETRCGFSGRMHTCLHI